MKNAACLPVGREFRMQEFGLPASRFANTLTLKT
jgi:hypothetical protein